MRLRQAISFFLIFLLSAFALAVDVALDGTHYPLRWGEREPIEDDLVKPYPPPIWANGYAACFKRGSQITLRLIRRQGDPEVQGWKVLYAELRSKVTGEVYWKHGESRMLGPNETYTLGSVPEFIEWAELRGSVIMMVGPPSEPEPGGSETSLLVQTIDRVTEIFVVLDEPKAPMDPAWVSVLRISCQWARGESTVEGAARKLTMELHRNGNYNGGELAYTRYPSDPDTGEYFYLRAYLEDDLGRGRYWGQCNDFADFLTCLITSVGTPRSVQRTHPLVTIRRITDLPNGNPGYLLVFETNPLDAAPTGPSSWDGQSSWAYHQFCLDWANNEVWDGSIAFILDSFVFGLPREPDYRNHLVLRYIFLDLMTRQEVRIDDPSFFWQPTPSPSGFIPGVYASALPSK